MLFTACIPAIPYAPSAAFIAKERAKLAVREGRPRVAIVADGIGAMHGVTRTIEEIRERGVDGFEIEVIGTDRNVDRRLTAVADVEIPHYPGMEIGVPSLPAAVEAIADGRYDLIHVCAPGPSGVAAALLARAMEIPLRRQLPHRACRLRRAAQRRPRAGADGRARRRSLLLAVPARALAERRRRRGALGARHPAAAHRCAGTAASTRRASIRACATSGCCRASCASSTRGASARRRTSTCSPTPSRSRTRRTRACTSCSPAVAPSSRGCSSASASARASSAGSRARSWRRAYASADAFCFPSETDTFGQVVLEAQASGLPVLAVDAGGPRELISDGVDGLLRPASADGPRRGAAAARRLARAAPRAGHRSPAERRAADLGARAGAPRRRLPQRARAGGARRPAMPHERRLAVAVHDIEPATFERAALIRDWLDDLGVDARHAARDPRRRPAPTV